MKMYQILLVQLYAERYEALEYKRKKERLIEGTSQCSFLLYCVAIFSGIYPIWQIACSAMWVVYQVAQHGI